jgi:hypothetical protein
MKTTLTILLLSVLTLYVVGQDTTLFIHKWSNPNKVKKLKKGKYCNIDLFEIKSDTSKIKKEIHLNGWFRQATDTTITIALQDEQIKIDFGNGLYTNINNTYFQDPHGIKTGIHYGDEIRTIKFNQIQTFSRADVKKSYAFGSALATISVLTALIVAPTVSINYRNGDFNAKKYYSVLTGCGIGFCIGLPISLASREQGVYPLRHYRPNTKGYYYLGNK